ncbi:MAG TPA: glycosyltransferase family 4 protein [Burkholderiales bacterium]|jgi:UDP-N-acetylmuramyl pentapeptide phosphotransferase/UDP-N-acetylglucosamine-1-phosphate transferase|nr:glycosyltransferase family 4 protein [Burkholderiales bacterium]
MPDIAFVSPSVAALATLALIVWMLKARGRLPLDVPNQRSLHAQPVPRSGGIAMMAGIFAGFALMQTSLIVVLPAALLVAFSHVDDASGLPIALRLGAQTVAAAALAYGALPALGFPVLAPIVLGMLWMTNLYNFMDGSDGLAGGMTVLGFSFLGAGAWMSGDEVLLIECAIVAAAGAAFLLVNFPPARLFMGDAGSVPLGFLAAAFSLSGWRDGDWPLWFPAAVFSPFIADATLTLVKRAVSGERVWEAHNKHYYQRLVRMGWGHRRTALAEYALMAACGGTALWALREPLYLQACALLGLVALQAALALWIDSAWRRSEKQTIESA